jgi:hypothetical protein
MISKFKSNHILIILLGFLSIAAFYGSVGFMIKPDGSLFNMNTEMLKDTFFNNYFIPGMILLSFFGLFPILIIISLIKKPNIKLFERFNLIHDYHFSWTFSVYIGFALIIWINIQTLILNSVEIIHTVYSSFGILIICIALLPSVRVLYKK